MTVLKIHKKFIFSQVGERELDEGGQKVQNSSYKTNKY